MESVRLQKFLSMAGRCSRRRGEVLIQEGRVAVNGVTVTQLGASVSPGKDKVTVDNELVSPKDKTIYIAMNKPAGVVSSCRHRNDTVVVDLVDINTRIFPVGRLDKESTGLILLTNDGPIHHRLSHPSFDHEKEYVVTTKNPISDQSLSRMRNGMIIDGYKTRKAVVKRLGGNRFNIVLKEGRNRQIRKMVAETGNTVVKLHRTRVAHIKIGQLKDGAWRYLTADEAKTLITLTSAPITGKPKRKHPVRKKIINPPSK